MKIKSLISLLCLCVLIMSCNEDSSDGGSSAPPLTDDEVASFASTGSLMTQSMSDMAIGFDSTPPSLAQSFYTDKDLENPRRAVNAVNNYTYNSSTNHWDLAQTVSSNSNGTSLSYNYNISIGLWEGGSPAQTVSTLEKVTMHGNMAFTISDSSSGDSVSLDMKIGNGSANPFTWSGINTSTVTMNGTFAFNIVANGQTVAMTMTLNSMSINRGGSNTYPTGTMTVSATANSQTFSGTIVYDGDSTAVATINGSTTTIDLSTAALVN